MSTGVYNKTAGDLFREALRAASITGANMPVDAADFSDASVACNDILMQWQTAQIHLWSETEAVMPLNPNQSKYVLGPNGDRCFTDYVFVRAEANLSGATAFIVESTSGITAGQNIGIELDNNSRQWTTVASVDSATQLTLNDALTDDVNDRASVFVYSELIDQPLRILSARFSEGRDYDEIPLIQLSRHDYFDQPTKLTSGSLSQWYYSRQLNEGDLYVWPVANRASQYITFTFIKPQYIPEDQSENILIPPEWYIALKWAVAAELGAINSIDVQKQAVIEAKAAKFFQDATDNDTEITGFLFHPERFYG